MVVYSYSGAGTLDKYEILNDLHERDSLLAKPIKVETSDGKSRVFFNLYISVSDKSDLDSYMDSKGYT